MNIYSTIHEAYLKSLEDVYFNFEYRAAPRGLPIREKTDYSFRITDPIAEPIITHDLERNKVIEDYTRKEMDLYNSCSNRVEDFAKASKFWEKLANPDGTINSAYGYLIWAKKSHGNRRYELAKECEDKHVQSVDHNSFDRTPWEWSKQALINDKDTRQAILRFSLPEHFWVGNRDMTCTMHGNWSIRENQLNFSIVMRSNDLNKGLVYDLSWFVSLMDKMVEELKPHYPDLTKGHYTHTAHSAHIYEKDEPIILKMLGL
jgi:thymidylate synthase